jgi:hypothetical protein
VYPSGTKVVLTSLTLSSSTLTAKRIQNEQKGDHLEVEMQLLRTEERETTKRYILASVETPPTIPLVDRLLPFSTQARKDYHARNRATAPGSLETPNSPAHSDFPVGSPRGTGSPGRPPGTPVYGKARTPGYASPGYRGSAPGSRVGTPGYTKSVNSPRPS